MSRVLTSKGVTLLVPLRDGRRVELDASSDPIPEDQVDEKLVRLIDGGDSYCNTYMALEERSGRKTSGTAASAQTPKESPETGAPGGGGDGGEGSGATDSGGDVDWEAVKSMGASDLAAALVDLRDSDPASFDAIIEWERSKGDDARKTVLRVAE